MVWFLSVQCLAPLVHGVKGGRLGVITNRQAIEDGCRPVRYIYAQGHSYKAVDILWPVGDPGAILRGRTVDLSLVLLGRPRPPLIPGCS